MYDKEMQGYLDRGTFVVLSEDEIENWDGPVNYISHHGVVKETSTSTKLRIMSNSSLNNNNQGLSFNDCLPKGLNSLILLPQALITWRTYPRVSVWDHVKCYNSVWTSEKDNHLRRFVWRKKGDGQWTVYVVDRMHFGGSADLSHCPSQERSGSCQETLRGLSPRKN